MKRTIDIVTAMGLNRHERRRLGKINHTKIPGVTKPTIGHETNTIQKEIHTNEENKIDARYVQESVEALKKIHS